ncbi:hypothetical protein GCM10007877_27430 [Marinibactrum halimedae]|uniref:Uncharacterized protein n=1 Tax=Marinibactrum halimedae TaxID=1444977 RepID=A0AA37T770_9GAMM|nr:hypothetical protein GCM10007877_27430 [Marinibactrum halimedae]
MTLDKDSKKRKLTKKGDSPISDSTLRKASQKAEKDLMSPRVVKKGGFTEWT